MLFSGWSLRCVPTDPSRCSGQVSSAILSDRLPMVATCSGRASNRLALLFYSMASCAAVVEGPKFFTRYFRSCVLIVCSVATTGASPEPVRYALLVGLGADCAGLADAGIRRLG